MNNFFCFLMVLLAVSCSESTSPAQKRRIKLTRKGFYPHWYSAVSGGSPGSSPGAAQDQPGTRPVSFVRSSERRGVEALDGWLSAPKKVVGVKQAKVEKESSKKPVRMSKLAKKGYCGRSASYGIRCGRPLNQCRRDAQCPGLSKCCQVSDCGLMCVKPEAEPPAPQKAPVKEKQKVESRVTEDGVTTAEGLKLEDIETETPKEDVAVSDDPERKATSALPSAVSVKVLPTATSDVPRAESPKLPSAAVQAASPAVSKNTQEKITGLTSSSELQNNDDVSGNKPENVILRQMTEASPSASEPTIEKEGDRTPNNDEAGENSSFENKIKYEEIIHDRDIFKSSPSKLNKFKNQFTIDFKAKTKHLENIEAFN